MIASVCILILLLFLHNWATQKPVTAALSTVPTSLILNIEMLKLLSNTRSVVSGGSATQHTSIRFSISIQFHLSYSNIISRISCPLHFKLHCLLIILYVIFQSDDMHCKFDFAFIVHKLRLCLFFFLS